MNEVGNVGNVGDFYIVDTHAHIYSEDEAVYPMIDKPLRPPKGTGNLEHLKRQISSSGVKKVVLVHTSTAYRWDNHLVADVCRDNADFVVGVCTLNPEDPTSVDILERYVNWYNIRGLRLYSNQEVSPPFGHEGHVKLWQKAAELGVVICALINPQHCIELSSMLSRFPEVRVVLDHCANLKASDFPNSENLGKVLAISKYANIYPKLSFLVTGSNEDYPCRDAHGIAKKIMAEFGAERCMWGSDFPCELWIPKVTYAQHLKIFTDELGLSLAEKRAILETTPMKLWFGKDR